MYDLIRCILLPVRIQESACGDTSGGWNFIKDERQLPENKSFVVCLSDKDVSSTDKVFYGNHYRRSFRKVEERTR